MTSKKEKLIARFLTLPSDFKFDEMVKLLGYFDFKEVKTGKSSGSRVRFKNSEGIQIMLHKPHKHGMMKNYQLKQVREVLGL